MYTFNPSIQETEVGDLLVQGQPGLHIKLHDSRDYIDVIKSEFLFYFVTVLDWNQGLWPKSRPLAY